MALSVGGGAQSPPAQARNPGHPGSFPGGKRRGSTLRLREGHGVPRAVSWSQRERPRQRVAKGSVSSWRYRRWPQPVGRLSPHSLGNGGRAGAHAQTLPGGAGSREAGRGSPAAPTCPSEGITQLNTPGRWLTVPSQRMPSGRLQGTAVPLAWHRGIRDEGRRGQDLAMAPCVLLV